MKSKKYIFIPDEDGQKKGVRLDIFLMEKIGVSRSKVQKMIDDGLVLMDDKLPRKPGDKLNKKTTVEVKSPVKKLDEKSLDTDRDLASGLEKQIKVVAETEEYVVLEKPTDLLVHPTEAGEINTLADWLLNRYPEIKEVGESIIRPGIVHRLDKEASGLMVVARTQKMYEHLKKQFQAHTIDKEYLVLVHGKVEKDVGEINFKIDRSSDGRMAARPISDPMKLQGIRNAQTGKDALTEFFVLKRFARFTLLSVKIFTGRTHQIRVHMSAYTNPVVGDEIYFNIKLNRKRDKELGRLFLHAAKLGFMDLEGKKVGFESELPVELQKFLEELK